MFARSWDSNKRINQAAIREVVVTGTMAGQLTASAVLGRAAPASSIYMFTQCSPKIHALSNSTFQRLGPSCLCSSRRPLQLVASGASSPLKQKMEMQSSFWSASIFVKDAVFGWSTAYPTTRQVEKKKAGLARAAGKRRIRKSSTKGIKPTKPGQWALIAIAVTYMTLLVFIPFINIFYQTFSRGVQPFIRTLLDPDFQHAAKMTFLVAGIAVPLNTAFGLVMAIWITRYQFPFKTFIVSLLDLPVSVSPVVVGLMLMLLYGRQGIFAPMLHAWNIEVVFALPGMVLATCFVTLPYVVREVMPSLLEMDPFEEEAARTMGANDWEVFCKVTFPNIRLGLLYGVILCNARAMGEFGAVSVVSGNIVGRTQTLTLFVESAHKEYNTQGSFSAALILSLFALITLFAKSKLDDQRMKQS